MPDVNAGPAARFAAALLDLKLSAGDPSYDRMRTQLRAAASKSALSAAARGRTLPTWPTTWEFVRSLAVTALGGDEESVRREWRERWETASVTEIRAGGGEAVCPVGDRASSGQPSVAGSDTSVAADPPDPSPSLVPPESPVTPLRIPSRPLWGVAATAVVMLGLVIAVVVLATPGQEAAAPRYPLPGDASSFGGDGLPGDVTFPDGATVVAGRPFTKIWRLKNLGSVPWHDRYLQVAGGTTVLCESPDRVPVPDTEPGALTEVRVQVTPRGTGICHVLWKMADARGALVFPERTGVYYQVRVTED
ncbi:transcriptional regulator [Amycolatopsis panacis]|uniref:Transcriptional regulator n=1 Tax=Amycolatopsis panacis TaxID=2340917 RepID=A0A419HPI2_9PSEU|nr:transcriptional regulator [Amycolatopsis panacis]